ncbi:MAG: SMP-30/gluconolactonase/LRE family protein [Candidatus Nanopelagicales bacterium]|jgi:sugar lactone lactonase YvrE
MTKSPLRPQRWRPPKNVGRRGPFGVNDALDDVEVIPLPGSGAEDVAVGPGGDVFTGTSEGHILRVSADGRVVERVAQTGGRPLGIEIHPEGWLVVCDAHRGLLRIDPTTGAIEELVTAVGGRPLRFTNNCAVADDGTIYFSDSSTVYGLEEFKGDILSHTSTGRVIRRTSDGTVDVVIDGLDFANGVALAEDESFLLVAETGGYRVTRLDLTGESSGRRSVIMDNMPGLPDNMSTGTGGIFWIALPSERNALLDALLPRPGLLRAAVWALPERLQPDASRLTWVIGIDGEGQVVHNLQGSGRHFHYVTGVREHDGRLYLGSLVEPSIAMISLR